MPVLCPDRAAEEHGYGYDRPIVRISSLDAPPGMLFVGLIESPINSLYDGLNLLHECERFGEAYALTLRDIGGVFPSVIEAYTRCTKIDAVCIFAEDLPNAPAQNCSYQNIRIQDQNFLGRRVRQILRKYANSVDFCAPGIC